MFKRMLGLAVVVIALVLLIAYSQWRPESRKVSGFVESDQIRLGSRVGGRVAEVLVEEGRRVTAGQVLIRLEPYDLQARLQQAEAELAARQAALDEKQRGFRPEEIKQAEAHYQTLLARLALREAGPREQEITAAAARLDVAKTQLQLAELRFERTRGLLRENAASQEDFDRVNQELQSAQAMLIVRRQELDLLESGTRSEELAESRAQLEEARQAWELAKQGYREEQVQAAKSARDAAQAAVQVIQKQIEELTVRAPIGGVIEALDLQPGDLITPNSPVISMMNERRLWVRTYVPQEWLHLHVGQAMDVTADSYGDEIFQGRISFIAREGEFTPSNIQTAEERNRQVFRIKVELQDDQQKLRPGMSVNVWLPENAD